MKDLIQELKNRKLISKLTDEINIKKILKEKKINLYCGFDPTADSLHIGHLIPLLFLKRFSNFGHIPIIVIGGATALLGDFNIKKNKSFLEKYKNVKNWSKTIENQILNIIKYENNNCNLIILNNYLWIKELKIINFLRDIGRFISINKILRKEIVKKKLKENQHISFMEFSYSLLQGYDYYFLNLNYDVYIQIGGSDQWSNIISGIDLVNKINKKKVYGITTPLLTRSNGSKLGKSDDKEKVIWLDKKKTSVYEFYQFWLNTPDEKIFRYLKLFTFISMSEINKLKCKFFNKEINPFQAQKILADEITKIVHGISQLRLAQKATNFLFYKKISELSIEDFYLLSTSGIKIYYPKSNENIKDILVNSKLSKSKNNAKSVILSSSIRINNKKQKSIDFMFKKEDKLFNLFTLIKKGKKDFCLLIWKNY
uniref:Tyrosine--tRNA ligase n=1 Tax=Wigglesworthia glossinidia brevipalpis TaxID=36870 RepID=SYY_WIGBR|nr:RecName: Full=Tyrosine--tRNA ligase; AltName: Full=Tyrosyl-tRNA synthetase; Short=TyrRS [Wigglesworthia glossinidia endosymbiont of Glossina brevipalpis]